jgi:hypothetical protein
MARRGQEQGQKLACATDPKVGLEWNIERCVHIFVTFICKYMLMCCECLTALRGHQELNLKLRSEDRSLAMPPNADRDRSLGTIFLKKELCPHFSTLDYKLHY